MGVSESCTVTVNVQGAEVLFAASVAVQLTVVVPTEKLDPEAGVQVTVGVPQLSVADGFVKVTVAEHCPVAAGWVMLEGQAPRTGFWLSVTVTVKVQGADILLEASVAVQLTVVVPTEKLDPEAGVQVTTNPVGQLSVAVGLVKVTVAAQLPFAAVCVMLVGQAPSTGNCVS